ncbi:heavy metal transporter [Agromyces sp. NPDC049794]|uniref:heavy metal transporter n=1 Tax=unclassified Agromyces TaxID=2639701 RepID=UPI0033D79218
MSGPDASGGTPSPEPRRAPGRPVRERVTSVDRPSSRTEALARVVRPPVSEADTLFTRSLMRAQGRLALVFVVSFLLAVVLVTFVISGIPALHDHAIAGVPIPWLIQAYGYYPIIIVFAVAYTVAAMRTERRFRALVEHE